MMRVLRRRARRFGLGLGMTTAILLAVTTAGAAVTTSTPFTGSTLNTCTGELVNYAGVQHTTTRVSTNGDRMHFGITEHLSGVTATTVTGARYAMTATQTGSSNFESDGAPSEFTSARTLILTRLGEDGSFIAGDDLRLHVVAHMTVSANGQITADFEKTRIECV